MGKDKLISGKLWEQYSQKVHDRMNNPKYRGAIEEEEAAEKGLKLLVADWGAEACGDAVRLFWGVNPTTEVVEMARFQSFGCGTAIASSDMMCELCIGKKVEDVLQINNLVVEKALRDTPDVPAVPPQKMHCSVMAHDVLKLAVSQFRGVDVGELEDREMVCHCARVTLGCIKDAIRLNDLKTVEQITQYTKAGAFCKSCIRPGGHEKKEYYLEDILRQTRAEMDAEKLKAQGGIHGFREMNFVRKGNVVQSVIDKVVAPILEKDGGSCEVVDVKDDGTTTTVYIQYGGACVGCSSSHTHTLATIEKLLQDHIHPAIKVIPVEGSADE